MLLKVWCQIPSTLRIKIYLVIFRLYLPSKLQEVPSTILALLEPHGLYEDGEAEYVRVEVQLQVAVDQLPPRLAGVEGEPVQYYSN